MTERQDDGELRHGGHGGRTTQRRFQSAKLST
ncbi:hypothetical protein A2U01_0090465, partial [Trifolium medium]|nr:hypothetical protein [Trifolium medium]